MEVIKLILFKNILKDLCYIKDVNLILDIILWLIVQMDMLKDIGLDKAMFVLLQVNTH